MPARASPGKHKSELPNFIVALLDASAYPHPTGPIELRQTHISYVLLAGEYVYKIKKPVNFGFLDYSTLDKREYFCHEEIRLNRRLCPEIYLGVVEIRETDGKVKVGVGKHLLEFAVKMMRLPENRMLSTLLAQDQVTEGMMQRLAAKLVGFYRGARGDAQIRQYGEPRWIAFNTEENFAQTLPYIGQVIPSSQFQLVKKYTEDFLASNAALFERRVQEGYIREGHGDLRPDSICFSNGLCIFDCVEFNERFRCGDVASDIAFLMMEMEYYSRFDLSQRFIESYSMLSGDKGIRDVLDFYKVYRAYVRGKVECFRLDEAEVPEEEKRKSLEAARRYFKLATTYIQAA